jgi:NAD(P)-dependent dehydrogenase (short-subunit alcohol dehydrogenase family)
MEFNLKGKTAVVTGGALGIGKATVLALVKHGVSVAVLDVDRYQAEAVAEEVSSMNGHAIIIETDVANELSVDRAVAMVLKEYGNIDILVNNAASRF